jgi:two-component system chemotaxis response regulator CheB
VAEAASGSPPRPRLRRPIPEQVSLVVVGASTGGPPALGQLLTGLAGRPRWPVLVVQHMAPGFTRGLASWLESVSSLPVRLAEHGERPEPGRVYLAPDGHHLELLGRRLRVSDAPPVEGHRPSVDALMASVASTGPASETLGVLLTGMGRDGASGLGLLHEAGAWTIAQDESTSVVYGMPKAAVEVGAAHEVLPLPEIAATLASLA